MQYYSALPLNITSGVTTIQGTAGRPMVAGGFIPRNAGVGPDFFTINLRVSWTLAIGRTRLEPLVECFNLTNRENVLALNGNFGSGAYPTNPSTTFGSVIAVSDPRAAQFGVRLTF